MLTLVMALSVCEAVAQYCGQIGQEQAEHCRFGIKWPNDLVVSVDGGPYKKCCGILTEMRIEEMEIRDIVVGIGINVNQMAFPAEIRETATSIALAMGRSPEMNGLCRAAITAKVWERFEENYALFEKAQSLSPLTDAYGSVLINTGREVHVLDPKGPYTGTALGITEGGDLIVRPADGSADRQVSSGEVSVRGVNGYV
jgi:BirA family biotin operon repressor/biotin-[acetyl-CoA-carboxylase] ligase